VKPGFITGLVLAALSLGGCSVGNLLGGGDAAPATQVRVPVGNELALPPDLALRAPTQTTDAYEPNGPVAGANDVALAPARPAVQRSVYGNAAPPADVYAKYGISKTKADGTPKTAQQLQKELRAAYLAEKRRTNPNYGTILNIGEIFSDG
jgi:hypothetical protein